jgi:hypothetical protein
MFIVAPAKAGVQQKSGIILDPGLRREDVDYETPGLLILQRPGCGDDSGSPACIKNPTSD